MKNKELLQNVIDKIDNDKTSNVIAGFDGYVDEIIHIVDKRINQHEYSRIEEMEDFANRIKAAAGLSANFELITTQKKLGGNGPIFANALAEQNHTIDYFGSLGVEELHPVFSNFATKCRNVFSWCNPGHTQALEFHDGKIMIGKSEHLTKIDWMNLLVEVGEDKFVSFVSKSDLIAITNWNALLNLNSIFIGINNLLSLTKNNPYIFIDLADPAKRTIEDIAQLLQIISDLNKNGKVIFGLNKNESRIIANTLGIDEDDVILRCSKIRQRMDIDYVVVHPLEGAVCASKTNTVWVDGPYTATPKMTTGAGDNFNSGFCNGMLLGMNIEESLAMGVMTSGYYVRNCKSPNRSQLKVFIQNWLKTI